MRQCRLHTKLKTKYQVAQPRFRFYLCLLVLQLLVLPSAYPAEDNNQAQDELEAVGLAIEEIQAWLSDANDRQSGEEARLRNAELEIASVTQSITAAQQVLAKTETELNILSNRSALLEADKAAQSQALAQLIRTAYMAGEQNFLKMLLNQQDISKNARMLHYYRVFSQSQIEKIAAFQQSLKEIAEVDRELQSTADEQDRQQAQLEQQRLRLNEVKLEREAALADLTTHIVARSSELEQLEIDQAELQQLIERINRAIARIPASAKLTPFDQIRGSLPLPVDGVIVSRFGSRYGGGNLTRQGITISVSEGTPVQAVHAGRIVFSDWLRGLGLLVIVDHGDGYMSLYGSNQALSGQAGDWVNAGDILATSGNTMDRDVAGIYFEIRHHGQAENPAAWLQNSR